MNRILSSNSAAPKKNPAMSGPVMASALVSVATLNPSTSSVSSDTSMSSRVSPARRQASATISPSVGLQRSNSSPPGPTSSPFASMYQPGASGTACPASEPMATTLTMTPVTSVGRSTKLMPSDVALNPKSPLTTNFVPSDPIPYIAELKTSGESDRDASVSPDAIRFWNETNHNPIVPSYLIRGVVSGVSSIKSGRGVVSSLNVSPSSTLRLR